MEGIDGLRRRIIPSRNSFVSRRLARNGKKTGASSPSSFSFVAILSVVFLSLAVAFNLD